MKRIKKFKVIAIAVCAVLFALAPYVPVSLTASPGSPSQGPKYAIIVVAPDANDPISMHLAFGNGGDRVYQVLKNLGFTDDNICYLSWNYPTPPPPGGFGNTPIVDARSTKNRIRRSLLEWLSPLLDNNQDDETVVIYFIDHGESVDYGLGVPTYYFVPYDHYNGKVSDVELSTWINDALTENDGSKNYDSATVVFETCYSGLMHKPTFKAAGTDRVLITATDETRLAYSWWSPPLSWFLGRPADSNGEPIFTYYFIKAIDTGLSVQDAFYQAYAQTQTEITRLALGGEEQFPIMDDRYPGLLYW